MHNTVRETINIPKGVDNGVNLRLSKKGHYSVQGPPGDLMVHVKVKSHPYFKRDGSDIYTELYVSVAQVCFLDSKLHRQFWELNSK